MSADHFPRCEYESSTGELHFFNCPNDRAAHERIARKRIAQITEQLSCPHGLTNRERRLLAKERNALQRTFGQPAPVNELSALKKHKKLKAAEKKLAWLARKTSKDSR